MLPYSKTGLEADKTIVGGSGRVKNEASDICFNQHI
jgi:hypothetical protein